MIKKRILLEAEQNFYEKSRINCLSDRRKSKDEKVGTGVSATSLYMLGICVISISFVRVLM